MKEFIAHTCYSYISIKALNRSQFRLDVTRQTKNRTLLQEILYSQHLTYKLRLGQTISVALFP